MKLNYLKFEMACAVIAVLLGNGLANARESILNSKHNLSATGPGTIKAATETDVCIFCHTPHGASSEAPLWNRYSSGASYTPYTSRTLKAVVGQPTGASKVCLSCHDGTVALGMVRSRNTTISMANNISTLPAGRTRLGTDLTGEHPISFTYDSGLAVANGQLKDPATLTGKVKLDSGKQMQCTSCHDPHDNQFGKFLVERNYASALCSECHGPNGWDQAVHKNSSATWNGQGTTPWPHTSETTVAANGCENCHTPHQAGTKPRLLNSPVPEQNCLSCHNGTVAAKNLQSEFDKFSSHPILTTGSLHEEAEDPINPPRHVTCVDCHNPHAAQASPPTAVHASGSLVGAKGVSSAGTLLASVTKESELCYRCHGDSLARGQATVPRQFADTNLRFKFAPGNSSFHPIESIGKDQNVPSLIMPWLATSTMTCADCHNNDQGPGAGGNGPRGPHGSPYPPILERQQTFTDFSPESVSTYALCYKCHSRDSILGDQSFRAINSKGEPRGHRFHIVDQQTACSTCHDSHGVQTAQHLINFNTTYVKDNAGVLQYAGKGTTGGTCTLTCHGFAHSNSSY